MLFTDTVVLYDVKTTYREKNHLINKYRHDVVPYHAWCILFWNCTVMHVFPYRMHSFWARREKLACIIYKYIEVFLKTAYQNQSTKSLLFAIWLPLKIIANFCGCWWDWPTLNPHREKNHVINKLQYPPPLLSSLPTVSSRPLYLG